MISSVSPQALFLLVYAQRMSLKLIENLIDVKGHICPVE